jgi:hypothetical protein
MSRDFAAMLIEGSPPSHRRWLLPRGRVAPDPLGGAEIDDARPEPESAINDCAGEESLTAQLELREYALVKSVDRLGVRPVLWRHITEADDAEALGFKDFHVFPAPK